MKNIMILILICIALPAFAQEDIECVNGNCEGWHVWYERGGSFDKYAVYHFDNNTGTTAFNLVITVNFFDSFNQYLGRLERRVPGPIHQYYFFKDKFPERTSKITADIYWKDTY